MNILNTLQFPTITGHLKNLNKDYDNNEIFHFLRKPMILDMRHKYHQLFSVYLRTGKTARAGFKTNQPITGPILFLYLVAERFWDTLYISDLPSPECSMDEKEKTASNLSRVPLRYFLRNSSGRMKKCPGYSLGDIWLTFTIISTRVM